MWIILNFYLFAYFFTVWIDYLYIHKSMKNARRLFLFWFTLSIVLGLWFAKSFVI